MTENDLTLNGNSKPTAKDRFAPTDTQTSLSQAKKIASVEGSQNNDRFMQSSGYDMNKRYTADDFANSITRVNSSQLPDIPNPPNFVQRWEVSPDRDDASKIAFNRALMLGWKVRPVETIPPEYLRGFESAGKSVQTDRGGFQFAELILLWMPEVKRELNRNIIEDNTRRQTAGVNSYALQQNKYSGQYSESAVDESQIDVTTGNGRVPPVGN